MNVTMAVSSSEFPLGIALPINDDHSTHLSMPGGYDYLQLKGGGVISQGNENRTVTNRAGLDWLSMSTSKGRDLTISGNITLSCIVVTQLPLLSYSLNSGKSLTDVSISVAEGSAVVFARTFSPGYSLSNGKGMLSASPTLDGLNLFVGAASGTHTIVLTALIPSLVAYFATLVANLVILISIFRGRILAILRFLAKSRIARNPRIREKPIPHAT